jgi:hypothetical protein
MPNSSHTLRCNSLSHKTPSTYTNLFSVYSRRDTEQRISIYGNSCAMRAVRSQRHIYQCRASHVSRPHGASDFRLCNLSMSRFPCQQAPCGLGLQEFEIVCQAPRSFRSLWPRLIHNAWRLLRPSHSHFLSPYIRFILRPPRRVISAFKYSDTLSTWEVALSRPQNPTDTRGRGDIDSLVAHNGVNCFAPKVFLSLLTGIPTIEMFL